MAPKYELRRVKSGLFAVSFGVVGLPAETSAADAAMCRSFP